MPSLSVSAWLNQTHGKQRVPSRGLTRSTEDGGAQRRCHPEAGIPLQPVQQAVDPGIVARVPPRAVRQSKQLLLATRADAVRAARAREDAAFAERIGSPENVEAITAFFEKRAPDFSRTR